jgi:Gly-Xaa carboxypeptidase
MDVSLPLIDQPLGRKPSASRSWRLWATWLLSALIGFHVLGLVSHRVQTAENLRISHGKHCKQVPPLRPQNSSQALSAMEKYLSTDSFRQESCERLSGAIQIPTESFDDLGPVGEDKRWEIMYDFAAYLRTTFPLVHRQLRLEKINTHGLLYTWQGTNDDLNPTLLMAHQDVVPVPASTVDAWTHPPFSGFNDGEYIWGRGSWDCKNQLIGILEAIEALIGADFVPQRTIVMPFGFDEEISGFQGASHLSQFLLERYGNDGIAAIVDEGAGFIDAWGLKAALPGVGEKGYTDVHVTVRMPGGHSSIPPDHTGIGVMSELITLVEADQYETRLAPENPFLELLQCGAEHASGFPSKLKKLLKKRNAKHGKDQLAIEAAKLGPGTRYLMQTSIATDLINGGVKVNALPERTTAVVNHRINIGESSHDVQKKFTHIARKIAKKYGLALHAFDGQESPSSITLSSDGHVLEPAPITPSDVSKLSPYSVLSGTTRALYGEEIIVAPGLMTGNTDTKFYWNLTKHIFRFTPGWDGKQVDLGNIHTVDEKVSILAHINMVKWMSLFIRNMDAADIE